MRDPQELGARDTRVALAGLGVAVVLGAFLRFWDLSGRSLYLDEAFVLDAARMPTAAMLQYLAAHDAHPPLFYLLAHAAVAHLTWPPGAYRYLTAPFGLLTIVCTWAVARRALGGAAAAIAAIVVATEPTLILFDRMFRMYPVATALGAASFWLMLAALDATGRKRAWLWVAYAAVAITLPAVLYLGALIVACQAAFALFDVRRRWPILAACATAPLALSPWWWALGTQWPQAGFAGGQGMTPGWHLARDVLGYAFPVDWYRGTAFDPLFTVVVVAILAGAVWAGRSAAIGTYLAPLALQTVATLIVHRNLLYGRYLIYLIPGIAIAFAAAAGALLRTRARIVGVVLLAAALAVNGVADTNFLLDSFYQLSDWNMVESIIGTYERPGDVMVFDQAYAYFILRTSPAVAGHEMRGPQYPAAIPATERWLDQHGAQRVWYVENQRFYSDPKGAVKQHLDAARPRLRAWLELRADPSNMVYLALYGPMKRGAP